MLTLINLLWVTKETEQLKQIPACVSNTVMVFNQWLILIHFWWVTNKTVQLVCTAVTVSMAQAYDGLQLATDTDLFLMGEK